MDVKVSVLTFAGGPVEREPAKSYPPIAAGKRSPEPPGPQEHSALDHEQIFDEVDINEPEGENLVWLAAYGEDKWGLSIRYSDMFGHRYRAMWRADTGEWEIDS